MKKPMNSSATPQSRQSAINNYRGFATSGANGSQNSQTIVNLQGGD